MKSSLLTFALLSLVAMPIKAMAAEVSLLFAAADEGDDRPRPAAGIHGELSQGYFARGWIYGRSFGPVTETTILIGGSKKFPAFGIKQLTVGIGACGLLEKTEIKYSDAPDEDSLDNRYNLGGVLGLHYRTELTSGIIASASWESYLFAAGSGIIFLSTARKQMLSFGVGVEL